MNRVWFDGTIQPAEDVRIKTFTHALHYGSGVFEGIRAYRCAQRSALFRVRDHVERFFRSAQAYGLEIPFDVVQIERAIKDTLEANAFTEGYVRPLAFFGEQGISLAPRYQCPTHVLIALRPLNGSLLGDGAGARVCISPWQKTPSRSLPATVKACGHYTNSILALQDAVARGFDEAILLNESGEVAEGTGENVFVIKNGRLHTNDASADILLGITRDTVIELARDRGVPVEIAPIRVADMLEADELFFTGTAAEVMPIVQVDEQRMARGVLTAELQRAYAAAVRGADRVHAEWVRV